MSEIMANVMADFFSAKQEAYRQQRLAHSEAWFQSNGEDFCRRKDLDPDTGKPLERTA